MKIVASVATIAVGLACAGAALAGETVTYTYDAKGRLTKVVHTGTVNNNVATDYAYDGADNRSNVTTTGSTNNGDITVLSIANASATEGAVLGFTVTRSGPTTAASSASYATSSGTATSDSDFTAASGTVTFAIGETSKTISVSTIDDTQVEATETMTVTLSNPSGASLGNATGTGSINDNDAASGSIIVPVNYTVSSNWNNYTGTSGTGAGMRDLVYNLSNSVHGTLPDAAGSWIMMDLGTVKSVWKAYIVPIPASYDGWGPGYILDAQIQTSNDGTNWTTAGTIASAQEGVASQITINASVRYVRLFKPGWLGAGDFHVVAP